MRNVFRLVLVIITAVLIAVLYQIGKVHHVPQLEDDTWWGKGHRVPENRTVFVEKLQIDHQVIANLYQRLRNTKPFHPSLEGSRQSYGIHSQVLNQVLDYWKNHYNWTERLQIFNQYQHSFTEIRGLKIHFLHIKPQIRGRNLKVLPLMMLHGWLGSFREFYEVIPKLTQPQKGVQFVFELVIPSLPGFAFSEASSKPGLSAAYMAQIMADLMEVLGHDQYYVFGEDWGAVVANFLAFYYPQKTLGMHSTFCFHLGPLFASMKLLGRFLPSLVYEEGEAELCNSPSNSWEFLLEESGYYHLQATKPDTIGVALRESPMGLAAYMIEKISTFTNAEYRQLEDSGLTRKFTMDQLLDTVMIYWVTESITSSMRIYAEAFRNYHLDIVVLREMTINVPVGCARFPHEIWITPKSVLKRRFLNLIHLTQYDRGGHFAAFEEPELFAQDVYAFAGKVESSLN